MKRREEKPTRDCSPHKDFVGRVRQRLYRKLLLSRQVRSGAGDAMDVGDKAESAADSGRMDRETTAADTANKSNPENPAATTAATNPARPNPAGAGHSDDDSGCALEEYTWVPPGLKPDQVGNKRDGCLSLFHLMLIFWA